MAGHGELHASGRSKQDVYGWKILDKPGTFEMVPKAHLNVYRSGDFEDGYQRHRNSGWLNMLAQAWSWVACGALIVARRCDRSLWVIDGSGRKLAADKLADITALPCMIYDLSGVVDEARFFVIINSIRTGMKSLERFTGEVVSQNTTALAVTKMVEASGYKIGRSGEFSVGCPMLLTKMYDEEPAVCQTAWDIAAELHNGEPINNRILSGLFYLENYLQEHGDERNKSLMDSHNRAALLAAGTKRIIEKIHSAVELYGGGQKAFAYGISLILNHKRTSRKVELTMAV